MIPNSPAETQGRIREEDLMDPSLLVLAKAEAANHGPISTSALKKALKASLHESLSDEDLAPLKNRSDTKVDQVIRNLVSHKTLTRQNLVTQDAQGLFSITEAGKARLFDTLLAYFPMPDLSLEPRKVRATKEANVEGTEGAEISDATASQPSSPEVRARRPAM